MTLCLAGLAAVTVRAQILTLGDIHKINADSIRADFDKRPYFGLYKDNFFTIGTVMPGKPTKHNSDVKFQVSISQRLTKSVLPFNSYLFLFYSQKAFWNIFEPSLPFHDLNFNPGIGLSRLIIVKGRLIGKMTLMIEHESNGRDGAASRSWNKLSFGASAIIDPRLMVHAKFWVPFIDGKNNGDILKYCGIYQAGFQAMSSNRRWVFDMTFVKRKGWNFNGNLIINLGFRLFPKHNQFLMLHYYNGYGESMLDYDKYHSRLRIGLLIRPPFFSDF